MPSIKESVSILKVYNLLTGNNLDISYVKRSNISCPFHDDAKASAHIYVDTNTLYCFSCNKSWSPVKFIQEYSKCTLEEAKRIACEIGGIEYKPLAPMSDDEKIYYDVYKFVAGLFNFINIDTYFKDRGLSKETIDKYKLGYCPIIFNVKFSDKPVNLKELLMNQFPSISETKLDALQLYDYKGISRYIDRYTFPIFDKYSRVVGFTARAKEGVEPKYYNTPNTALLFDKKNLLYNYHVAIEYPNIYVVEGTFDALTLINAGINNVVAPLGTSFTNEQIQMLSGKDIILSLDNDKAGKNTMYKLINQNPLVHFNVLLLDKYKDFNDALKAGQDIKSIVKVSKTMSAIEYIIYTYKNCYPLKELSNRVSLDKKVNYILDQGKYSWVEKDYYNKIIKRLFIKETK